MEKLIQFDSLVHDNVTGLEGRVLYRVEHMNNCVRYGVQPPLDKDGKLPEVVVLDGPNLKVIGPPREDLPPAIETPNAFRLGVTMKDLFTNLTGVAVLRIKQRHTGDRYGIQAPMGKDKKIPEVVTFDEEDLVQIDPPPALKKKDPEKKDPPNGPHDRKNAIAR